MAITFVQAKSQGYGSSDQSACAVTVSALGTGALVAGVCTWTGADVNVLQSVTDNKSGGTNTYTIKRRIPDSSNGQCAASFYGYNLAGNPTEIKANFSPGLGYTGISIIEFAGAKTTDPLDGTNEQGQLQATPGTGTDGATSGTGTQTPSEANCVVFGGSVDTGALNAAGGSEFAAGTNFIEPTNAEWSATGNISLSSEYWIQTTATASNASFTLTQGGAHITFQMIFKSAAGGGGAGGIKRLPAQMTGGFYDMTGGTS